MEPIDLDLGQLEEIFRDEAQEQLAEMERLLVELERRPADGLALLDAIFRGAHTLKGNAASVGFDAVAELAHGVEGLLDAARARAVVPADAAVTLLLGAVDAGRRLLASDAGRGATLDAADRRLIAALAAAAPGGAACAMPVLAAPDAVAADAARTLRVDLRRLDRILDLAGELAVARGRLGEMLARSGESARPLLDVHGEADRVFAELQHEILRARLVPLGPTFRQHVRTVRESARLAGKAARLETIGDDVEVDAAIVEQVRGPLTHLVRNAVDHGLEAPEARAASGKPPLGRIRLEARHEAGGVVIEVGDDGAGLDGARVAQRARERGLVVRSDLAPADMLRIILQPGFSTAETVSALSGRGVGLDVVRRSVEALRGSLDVESRPGMGATFSIRVPLTIAIIEGFLVTAADEVYVIPMDAVVECADLPAGALPGTNGVVVVRGAALSCLRLSAAFGLTIATAPRESLVVVAHRGERFGLAVDTLVGERQILVKPLAPLLANAAGIAGSTVLGDGRAALIVDVPTLVGAARRRDQDNDGHGYRRERCSST